MYKEVDFIVDNLILMDTYLLASNSMLSSDFSLMECVNYICP